MSHKHVARQMRAWRKGMLRSNTSTYGLTSILDRVAGGGWHTTFDVSKRLEVAEPSGSSQQPDR